MDVIESSSEDEPVIVLRGTVKDDLEVTDLQPDNIKSNEKELFDVAYMKHWRITFRIHIVWLQIDMSDSDSEESHDSDDDDLDIHEVGLVSLIHRYALYF